jgi:hypothetical protein
MKYEIECNTIYPIIYMILQNASALFLTLLENSGIRNEMQHLLINDVTTKLPVNASALLLALLENCGINKRMQYLFIDDVITRIQAYMIIFMTRKSGQ